MTTTEPISDSRLAFLPPGWPVRATEALATIRCGPRSPTGRGCAWCGVARARHWQPTALRWPDDTKAHLCPLCARRRTWAARTPLLWRAHLWAELHGCDRAPIGTGVEDGLLAYLETDCGDCTGTTTRFEYTRTKGER